MAHTSPFESATSSKALVDESSGATSLASCESTDAEITRGGVLKTDIAGTSESVHRVVQSSLIPSRQSQVAPSQQSCTDYGSKPLVTPLLHSFSTASHVLQPETSSGVSLSGSRSGTFSGSGSSPSTTAPRLIVFSPASSLDEFYCQQRSVSTDCSSFEDHYASRGSTAASISGGSGSPMYRPSGFPSFPQKATGVPPRFLSYSFLKDAVPAQQTSPSAYPPLAYVEKHQEGGSTSSASGSPQAPLGVSTRRDGATPKAGFQAFSSPTMGCISFGPRTGPSPTPAPAGVPVSRHFDPLRSSPFDLSKFDRRDPYLHFYVPVDCPFGRRCCDGACPLAHTKLEKIFHPIVYKTQRCQMAQMALTGRCQYIHKCAFFHTEEDRQEAELQWKGWEAEWASWRQQIDQLLLNHNKLEKEIRRKVEGILKIRMPRPASNDLHGRNLGSFGLPGESHGQQEAIIQQNVRGARSFPKESRIAAVWCSAGSGESPVKGAFGDSRSPGLSASMIRLPDASSQSLEQGMASCNNRRSIACSDDGASSRQRRAIQEVRHQPTPHLRAGREWLYLQGAGESGGLQRQTLGRDASSGLKADEVYPSSGLHGTVAPSGNAAYQYSHELLPIPELNTHQGTEDSWLFEHICSQGTHETTIPYRDDVYDQYQCAPNRTTPPANGEQGSALQQEERASVFVLQGTSKVVGEKDPRAVTPSSIQHRACQSVPVALVPSKSAGNVPRGQRDFESIEGKVAVKSRDQVSKEQGSSAYTSYPKPLNFIYCKQPQFPMSDEGKTMGHKVAGAGNSPLMSRVDEYGAAEEFAPVAGRPASVCGGESLTCWAPSCGEVRGLGSGRERGPPTGGLLSNWCSPNAIVCERGLRQRCYQTAPPRLAPKASTGLGRGMKGVASKGGSSVAPQGGARAGCLETFHTPMWQQRCGKSKVVLTSSEAAPSLLTALEFPVGIPEEEFPACNEVVVSQQQRAAEEDNVSLPEDELHLLTRNLNHLLNEAAEEIRRLEILGISGAPSTHGSWQAISRRTAAPADPVHRFLECPCASGPSSPNEGTEVAQASCFSSPTRECHKPQNRTGADAAASFEEHEPD